MHISTSSSRLSKRERQEKIVRRFQEAPSVRASNLAVDLGVSNETIRRDLMELDAAGLIARTFGGAVRPLAAEPPINERQSAFVEQRTRMATLVSRMIRPHDVVMIGSGGTTYHVALTLAARNDHITVVTHGLNIAAAFATNPTISVLILPGRYNGREGYTYGSQTVAAVDRYEANWAVVGATGIDARGIYDANDEGAAVHRTMALRASKALLVVDSSKFDSVALSNCAAWSEIHALVTDSEPAPSLRRAITEAGCLVLTA